MSNPSPSVKLIKSWGKPKTLTIKFSDKNRRSRQMYVGCAGGPLFDNKYYPPHNLTFMSRNLNNFSPRETSSSWTIIQLLIFFGLTFCLHPSVSQWRDPCDLRTICPDTQSTYSTSGCRFPQHCNISELHSPTSGARKPVLTCWLCGCGSEGWG